MSHDKVVGFCEPNKCKVEVPNKEDFDDVEARLTACEDVLSGIDFDSNGNLVGNIAGKLAISSLSTNTNNIRVCTLTTESLSAYLSTAKGASQTFALSPTDITIARHNESIITFAVTDEELLLSTSLVCTVSFAVESGYSRSYLCTVTRDSDSTVLVSSTQYSADSATCTLKWTFDRALGESYTVVVKRTSNTTGVGGTISITTPTTIMYAP